MHAATDTTTTHRAAAGSMSFVVGVRELAFSTHRTPVRGALLLRG